MLFEDSNYGPLLAGQSTLSDRAVGDEIEMIVGRSSDVRYAVTRMSETVEKQRFKVDITNARSEPVNVEVEIPFELRGKPKHIAKVDEFRPGKQQSLLMERQLSITNWSLKKIEAGEVFPPASS